MLVLSIVGIIALLFATYMLITAIDEYSKKTYDYEFFNAANFTLAFIANLMLYFGYGWYAEAIAKSGDTLNGLLIIFFGSALLLVLLYINLKSTSLLFGIVVSIVQLTLFGVASYFAFFALALAIAWFAQTKPVYSINND